MKCLQGNSCTNCTAKDYLTVEERAQLDMYMDAGGRPEDLPLRVRRVLEEETESKIDDAIELQRHSHGGGVWK